MSADMEAGPGAMFVAPPMSEDHLLRQSEILAMRQMADTMAAMRVTQEAIVKAVQQTRDKVDDVKERVIRLEERNEQVERLRQDLGGLTTDLGAARSRIDALESDRDQRAGALKGARLLKDFAPWVTALLVAVAALAFRKAGL